MSDIEKEIKSILDKAPKSFKCLLLTIIFSLLFGISAGMHDYVMTFGSMILMSIFIILTMIFMYGDMTNGS